MPSTPGSELRQLSRFIREAEAKFLSKHGPPLALGTPDREELLDVAAFVVLVHGAIENFVEGIGLWALGRIEDTWIRSKRASRCTVALLHHADAPKTDWRTSQTVFEVIRLGLDNAAKSQSKTIRSNHGIAMKDLRAILRPVGIDVPEDPSLVASLNLLVAIRHEWAHQNRFGAKNLRFASDVKLVVGDCLKFAELLAREASKSRP